jgi:hypothetical protein
MKSALYMTRYVMKRCLLLLAILSISVAAIAAEQRSWPGPAAWAGPGITTCADFQNAYHDNADLENLFFSWALGFMSGLNTSLMGHGETNLHGLSENSQKQFLRSTCGAHPHDTYYGAVFDLYNRMRKDQGLPSYFKVFNGPPK